MPNQAKPSRSPVLYTARYSNKTLAANPAAKIRTTIGAPRFKLPGYVLSGSVPELMPKREWWGNTPAEFAKIYRRHLDRIGVEKLTASFVELAKTSRSKSLVLLCFEDVRDPLKHCHRTVFAQWWSEKTGQKVLEVPEADALKPKQEKLAV